MAVAAALTVSMVVVVVVVAPLISGFRKTSCEDGVSCSPAIRSGEMESRRPTKPNLNPHQMETERRLKSKKKEEGRRNCELIV
ncbi:unnamed protein product [Linum tenue]|uniref:Secreted protein n=1 Tax=Linum tenue TaxID=586396 RepID=A0AAV0QMA1_9ROSI|nr:unnamed protein product [Linum tenue]